MAQLLHGLHRGKSAAGVCRAGSEGPRYRIAIQAVSDELLLDQLLMPPSKGATGETAGALMTALVTRTGSTALSTQGLSLSTVIGNFVPDPGAAWSKSAGQVASQARAAYRAVNGALRSPLCRALCIH